MNLVVKSINPKVIEGRVSSDKKLLSVKAKSIGDSWIIVYLEENPKVFDIFYAMVGPMIYPKSTASIPEGGVI